MVTIRLGMIFLPAIFSLELAQARIDQLQAQIVAGNRAALRTALDRFTSADGAEAEELSVAIGHSIRPHARMFLEELVRARRPEWRPRLDALVGALGPELVDHENAQTRELVARTSALKLVHQRQLRPARDECIAELNRQIALRKQRAGEADRQPRPK